ncbi:glycosyltransferase [Reichenbachiella versicolor]|uniref:glycosyltransferase n=1 Tax=Reichenbachiella versicolor TaxID=1821036 RepID=UPI000D6E9CC9|nr:glycosyltransferase family 2 protein [Reichenbachiella versicolor]
MTQEKNVYLERYAVSKTYIQASDYGNPDMVIVIPCHNEPDLISSLNSLENCHKPEGQVKVIVVINAGEHSSEKVKMRNQETLFEAKKWQYETSRKYTYHFILDNKLPKKHAGVGLARKIGMDEAVRIYESTRKNGPIICYDADSKCRPNYLIELEKLFRDSSVKGCSIHFEHPLDGDLDRNVYEGIINYELHLRCYVNLQKLSGFPYAHQTIGSSMAVRSSVYQKQGGMNKRKAGEDFYFLHKIIPLGGFVDLNTTMVIPSPRVSDRVPFGTGKAIGDWIESDQDLYLTYSPKSFEVLKSFFEKSDTWYRCTTLELEYFNLSVQIKSFISKEEFISKINEFNNYSTSLKVFRNRFFQWFDAFKLMKCVHHFRDEFFADEEVREVARKILNINVHSNKKNKELLEEIRGVETSSH